jgi:glycosyltransferase involved in cell wall biosynthesis
MAVRFSVLIPTYNREEHVRQAIESILAQTFHDYELFVIDDGSTDGTPQLLASYGTRVRALRQANQGPEAARNKAAALAEGEYLVMLDSDDLLMPHALAIYDRVIRAFDAPPLVIGSMTYFKDGETVPAGGDGHEVIEVWKCANYLSKDVTVGLSNSRIVLRKSVFDEVGGLRNSTPATFHLDDFNLILKVGTYGPCAIVKTPAMVGYRLHDSNSIRGVEAMVNGIQSLISAERAGQYPGGEERRFERYACIGGIAQLWVRKALKMGQVRLSLKLAASAAPMIASAARKKMLSRFRRAGIAPISLEGLE